MGLDMYLYAAKRTLLTSAVDFNVDEVKPFELHYWRKHPNLHGWMQRLYVEKGGKDPRFDLAPVLLDVGDLDALERAIKADGLPDTKGFFFGHSDGSEKPDDLEAVEKARVALGHELGVFYVAWW